MTIATTSLTCPTWCALPDDEHENIDTPESPVYVHWSTELEMANVSIRVGLSTDEKGRELEDDALTVHLGAGMGEVELSLHEAYEVGFKLICLVHQLLWESPRVREAWESSGRSTFEAGSELKSENHAKHESLREIRRRAVESSG